MEMIYEIPIRIAEEAIHGLVYYGSGILVVVLFAVVLSVLIEFLYKKL